jgi:aminopeptidase YwaD
MATLPPVGAPSQAALGITEAAIRGHMEFLASDALNGRAGGTRDEWIAATYIASNFRRWGLEPMGDDGGYVQQIEMAGGVAAAAPTLTAGGTTFIHGQQIVVAALRHPKVAGSLAKYQAGADVASGSVVLLPEGVPAGSVTTGAVVLAPETPQVRAQWAQRAAAMPALQARPVKLAADTRPTVIFLDKAAYASVSALPAGTAVAFAAELKPAAPAYTWNAVGKLTGSDPVAAREIIVLSAHLDHVGPLQKAAPGADVIHNGADDDASGTTAVMMLAEALSKGSRPRRTVVFALFGSEERGGFGAGYFVDLPVVPLPQIVADLQFEMLGRADDKVPPRSLWLTGYTLSSLGPELTKQGARLVNDPRPDQSFFTRSDNIRFARRGVIAHTVSSFNMHTDYHAVSDEVKTIDFAHMTDAIRSMLEPVRWLANSAFKPAWAANGCPAPCR